MEHPNLPALRTLSSPLLQFFVVMPNGHIKRCLYERNLNCGQLYVKWQVDDLGRKIALLHVEVDPAYAKSGWVALEDLYRAEDRLEDFAEYVKWSDHANSVPGTDQIPDEYLPDEVLRRRKDYVKAQRKVELKAPKRKRAAKGEG